MPPKVSTADTGDNKNPGLRARKQGVTAQPSRTARKASSKAYDGSDESDEENVIKSSSGSTGKTASSSAGDSASNENEDEAAAVRGALVGKDSPSSAGASPLKPAPAAAAGRGKNIPESQRSSKSVAAAPKPGAGKTSLKAVKANANKRRHTESPAGDESDEDSSHRVSSRSRSGHSSSYLWDVDVPAIRPQDIGTKLTYHKSINTQLEREGKTEKVRFRRGDKLWILPDPTWLPEVSHDVEIHELDDDEFWVAEVLDCCSLDQTETGGDNLGLLRVAWYYTGDHALDLKNLHEDYKKKIRRYRFDDNERIRSDHIDFIGIECFAGFADGIEHFLSLTGLEVDDKDRLKPPAMRPKNKRIVMMVGFKVKDTLVRQQARASQVYREKNKRLRRADGEEEEA